MRDTDRLKDGQVSEKGTQSNQQGDGVSEPGGGQGPRDVNEK